MYIENESLPSVDGVVKYLVAINKYKKVETVYLPKGDHIGLCVSTQVGCNMGCSFCLTGQQRNTYNLKDYEIFEQVQLVVNQLKKKIPDLAISFVTLAGMGEPLANYKNSTNALDRLIDFYNLQDAHISTVGIVKKIWQLVSEKRSYRLYISLHAADDNVRKKIMPIAKFNPIEKLIKAASAYAEINPLGRVKVSYLLLKGINDSEEQLEKLCKLLKNKPFEVKILFWNEAPGLNFERLSLEEAQFWHDGLKSQGIKTTLNTSKGRDVLGACGQLTTKKLINCT